MITVPNPWRLLATLLCLGAYCALGQYGEAGAFAIATTLWSFKITRGS